MLIVGSKKSASIQSKDRAFALDLTFQGPDAIDKISRKFV